MPFWFSSEGIAVARIRAKRLLRFDSCRRDAASSALGLIAAWRLDEDHNRSLERSDVLDVGSRHLVTDAIEEDARLLFSLSPNQRPSSRQLEIAASFTCVDILRSYYIAAATSPSSRSITVNGVTLSFRLGLPAVALGSPHGRLVCCGLTSVLLTPEDLIVDAVSYGPVSVGDVVNIDPPNVLINGVERRPA